MDYNKNEKLSRELDTEWIKKVAKKLKLPERAVRSVISHQWLFLVHLINSGSWVGVGWPVIGRFVSRRNTVTSVLVARAKKRLERTRKANNELKIKYGPEYRKREGGSRRQSHEEFNRVNSNKGREALFKRLKKEEQNVIDQFDI